jgi:hypothetical protein
MLVIVKSREIQRAMQANDRGDRAAATKHYLASAHLELVLADDYQQAGDDRLAFRSRISAASCFWLGGQRQQAETVFEKLEHDFPDLADEVSEVRHELEQGRKD